jgi:hypothetical protein
MFCAKLCTSGRPFGRTNPTFHTRLLVSLTVLVFYTVQRITKVVPSAKLAILSEADPWHDYALQ